MAICIDREVTNWLSERSSIGVTRISKEKNGKICQECYSHDNRKLLRSSSVIINVIEIQLFLLWPTCVYLVYCKFFSMFCLLKTWLLSLGCLEVSTGTDLLLVWLQGWAWHWQPKLHISSVIPLGLCRHSSAGAQGCQSQAQWQTESTGQTHGVTHPQVLSLHISSKQRAPATCPAREKEVRSLKPCVSPAAIFSLAAVTEDWEQGSVWPFQQLLPDACVCPVCTSDSCGCLPVFPGALCLEIWDGTTQSKNMVELAVPMLNKNTG